MIRRALVMLLVAGLAAAWVGCQKPEDKTGKTVDKQVKQPPDKTTPTPTATPAVKPVKDAALPEGKPVQNLKAIVAVAATEKPVKVDAKLDDSAWKNAVAMSGFITEERKPADQDSRVLVSYDKDNLYVAVINFELNTDKLKMTTTTTDGPVWSDDCVEIYLDAKDGDYYGFFVSANGTRYDRQRSESWSGKGKWTSAAQIIAKKAWVVETAIPFKTLGVTPKPGLKLGIMVARDHQAGTRGNTFYLADCRGEAKDTSRYVELELK